MYTFKGQALRVSRLWALTLSILGVQSLAHADDPLSLAQENREAQHRDPVYIVNFRESRDLGREAFAVQVRLSGFGHEEGRPAKNEREERC